MNKTPSPDKSAADLEAEADASPAPSPSPEQDTHPDASLPEASRPLASVSMEPTEMVDESSTRPDAVPAPMSPDAFAAEGSSQSSEAPSAPRREKTAQGPRSHAPESTLPPTVPGSVAPDYWADFEDPGSWSDITRDSDLWSEASDRPSGATRGEESSHSDTFDDAQAPRLVGIKGQDEGREFIIRHREVGVGRDPKVTAIALSDGSVSREHARLLCDGDRYVLIDNRSANGTFVAGHRIDRARIRGGDVLAFGDAVFRFLEPGQTDRPDDESVPGPKKLSTPVDTSPAPPAGAALARRVTPLRTRNGAARAVEGYRAWVRGLGTLAGRWGRVFGVALFLGVVSAGVVFGQRFDTGQRQNEAFDMYLQGVDAFKARRWSEAEKFFSDLLAFDSDHERGRRYLQAVMREQKAERLLQQGRSQLKAGQLESARRTLLTISGSEYDTEAKEALTRVDGALDEQLKRARTWLAQGEQAQAHELLQEVRRARPDDPVVAQLLASASGPSTKPRPESTRPSETTKPSVSGRERPGPKRTQDVIRRARARLAAGEVREALTVLKNHPSKETTTLRQRLLRFDKLYRGALQQSTELRPEVALRHLTQARTQAIQLAGRSSKLVTDLSRRAADANVRLGDKHDGAGQSAKAFRAFRRAVVLVPDHVSARERLTTLEGKAQRLFRDATQAKAAGDPDQARQKWARVLDITGPDTEIHRNAKEEIKTLNP